MEKNMGEDREVLREVWQGRIPTAFTLASEDVTSISPQTFYLMLPRLSYFALVSDKIRKYFGKFINEDLVNEEIWFEFGDIPLKLHLPIGLLYDQLKVEGSSSLGPPWKLTVHFSNFPEKDLLKCDNKESMESHFMSCVKEADQFKHGGRIVSTMQKKDHNQLWQGLSNDKFDQFWAVNRRLMEVNPLSSARASTPTTNTNSPTSIEESNVMKTFKHIPIRMYQSQSLLALKLIKPTKTCDNGSERWTTLEDILIDYFPNLNLAPNCNKVITQGIEPGLDTPLQWMAEHLSYPDNFLHIVTNFQ